MNIEYNVLFAAGGLLVGLGVSWGTIQSKVSQLLSHKEHQAICHNAIDGVYTTINELRAENRQTYGMVKEIHGILKVKKSNLDDTNS